MTPLGGVTEAQPSEDIHGAAQDEETRTQFLKPYLQRTYRAASEADVSHGEPISKMHET